MSFNYEDAYLLSTCEEQRDFYNRWAQAYDDGVIAEGYDYPSRVAAVLVALALNADSPVVDVGCGTGLVGRALNRLNPALVIDGLDVSSGMLAVAGETGVYRQVHEADMFVGAPTWAGRFGSVISAGAFTMGHLDPRALRSTLDLGWPGALFVLGVNRHHFNAQDFGSALDALQAEGLMEEWTALPMPIWERGDVLTQGDIDTASVVVFRRSR